MTVPCITVRVSLAALKSLWDLLSCFSLDCTQNPSIVLVCEAAQATQHTCDTLTLPACLCLWCRVDKHGGCWKPELFVASRFILCLCLTCLYSAVSHRSSWLHSWADRGPQRHKILHPAGNSLPLEVPLPEPSVEVSVSPLREWMVREPVGDCFHLVKCRPFLGSSYILEL